MITLHVQIALSQYPLWQVFKVVVVVVTNNEHVSYRNQLPGILGAENCKQSWSAFEASPRCARTDITPKRITSKGRQWLLHYYWPLMLKQSVSFRAPGTKLHLKSHGASSKQQQAAIRPLERGNLLAANHSSVQFCFAFGRVWLAQSRTVRLIDEWSIFGGGFGSGIF